MTPPLTYDVRGGIRNWHGLGNFQYGDCVIAAFEHLRMVKGVANDSSWRKLLYQTGFRPPHTPYSVEIYAEYLATQGEKPGGNVGVDPASFLAWAESKNLILGWGEISQPKNRDSLHQAMVDYTGVLTCVELTTNSYDNWNNGKAWDVGPGPNDQPNPNLAHATALVRYGIEQDAVVTWGAVKSQTAAYTELCTYQAFVFLDAQDTTRPNFNQLLANIKNL